MVTTLHIHALSINNTMVSYGRAIHGCHARVGSPPTRVIVPNCNGASGATPLRRTANYQPSLWSSDYIQSLRMNYVDGDQEKRCAELKEVVWKMVEEEKDAGRKVDLIDSLGQLGVAYHFEEVIENTLSSITTSIDEVVAEMGDDLHAVAQLFRVLRSYGFEISTRVFNCFMDVKEGFSPDLCHDHKGLLSLYEASFLGMVGEDTMDKAREFTSENLHHHLEGRELDKSFEMRVSYALEMPIHWRYERLHTRWFIDAYKNMDTMNPILLELAKLDFNSLQNIYKNELKTLSRWWNNLHVIGDKTRFARDRMVEIYFWSVGWIFEPQYKRCRAALTKIASLITTIDDVYDLYASPDELYPFNEAISRWDANEAEKLPEYMKIFFFAIFNMTNDVGYEVIRDNGVDIIPCLKNAVKEQCNTFMEEAKWYHSGYIPSFKEYMNQAWISIGGPLIIAFAYCTSENITLKSVLDFDFWADEIRTSSIIFRLSDDLGTSLLELARGDIQKAPQCYMHDKGVSEAAARREMKRMIAENWKVLNGYRIPKSIKMDTYRRILLNVPRTAQCMYQHGDGFAEPGRETKDRILSVLVDPVPL